MKKLLKLQVIIFFFLVPKLSFTQAPIYNTCSALSNFNGEWKYENGNEILKVYLKAHTFYIPNANTYVEKLLGWQEYTVGGTIIQSDYDHRFDNLPSNFHDQTNAVFSIGLNFSLCKTYLLKLYGGMSDISKGTDQSWVVTRISENVLEVKQYQMESSTNRVKAQSLPEVFTLIRQ